MKQKGFEKEDWSKTNKQIAEERGCSNSYASQMRRKYAPETLSRNLQTQIAWSEIDWTKSNKQIAKEYGVSKSTAQRRRRQYETEHNPSLGKGPKLKAVPSLDISNPIDQPKTPDSFEPKSDDDKAFCKFAGALDWKLSNTQLLERTCASLKAVFAMREVHAPDTVVRNPDYAKLDWSKRNYVLAQDLGLQEYTIYVARARYAPQTIEGYDKAA